MRVHEGPEPSDSPELSVYRERAKQSINQFASEFTLKLKAHNVAQVRVVYGAGEDDGGIESITYYQRAPTGELVAMEEPPLRGIKRGTGVWEWIEDPLEGFMYNLMTHRGYFNQNEGCQGIIRWDIENDTIIHDHQSNVYGEGEETGEEWKAVDGTVHKEYKTLYIPLEVETYYGVDDIDEH